MTFRRLLALSAVTAGCLIPTANGHQLPHKPFGTMTLKQIETFQLRTISHANSNARFWAKRPKLYAANWKFASKDSRFHRQLRRWTKRELIQTRAKMVPVYSTSYWAGIQIHYATLIGRSARVDPWPNCSDPIWDGAASWNVTLACENGGNWLDSPGLYRCGLQFHPNWEVYYKRKFCP